MKKTENYLKLYTRKMSILSRFAESTPDTRKNQLLKKARQFDFNINQKIYGVFAYWQQPGCYGCYLLTSNHDHAVRVKRKEVKENYGDYDARRFRIEYDTAENLMLKYTTVSVRGISSSFTFPDFLSKFEQFLQDDKNEDDLSISNCSGQLSEIDVQIESIISNLSYLSKSEQNDVVEIMTSIKEKIEDFTANLSDSDESSLSW